MTSSLRLLVLVAVLGSTATGAEPAAGRLNIVVFLSDDHSQVDSEPYGSTELQTPNMAQLARDGMRFTHAFVASPACGPSRAALLTGLWPARNGAEPNHKNKRPDVAPLPPVLKKLGYEVAAIGKVAHGAYAVDYDFDFVAGPNRGITDTNAVAEFLDGRDASKPLCLFVGTRHPHVPWTDEPTYDAADVQIPRTHIDTPETRSQRASYLSDVSTSDRLLGEVRELTRTRVPGETLFIYTADHGAQWPFGKWNLYDAGIRVPFIAVWPKHLQPGSTSDAMICWPDLLPTLIELAGGTVPEGLDGKSFAGVLRGETAVHRDRIFTTHSGDGDFNVYPIRSVRTRDWKYIRNLHPEFQHHSHISRSSGPSGRAYWGSWESAAKSDPKAAAILKRSIERPAEELYDLVNDPLELNNLAGEANQKDRMAQLSGELDAWMESQGDQQTVFGLPLLKGEEPTLIAPGGGKKKTNNR